MMRKYFYPVPVFLLFLFFAGSITHAQTVTQQKGLTTAVFSLPEGNIKLYLPADIRPGDQISCSILAESFGKNSRQTEKNLDGLIKHSVRINNEKFAVGKTGNSFHFIVQMDRPLIGPVELLNVSGTKLAELAIPVLPPGESKPVPDICMIPSHGLTGAPLRITGFFDGNSSNTSCSLGNKELPVLAESPRECIVSVPGDASGVQTLTIKEDQKIPCTQTFTGVDMAVSAGKLNLQKGETTYIDVSIKGLQNLPDTAKLSLANITPGVVAMQPANLVVIPLPPDSVGSGTFDRRFNIQSLKTGTFTVNVELDLPEVSTVTPGTTEKVPPGYTKKSCECSATATVTKTGANSFRVDAKGECKGAYGIGINTFSRCEVRSIAFEWSMASGKENAGITGKNNGTGVTINTKNNGNYVVCVKVTVTCIDGGTCTVKACADQSGKTVPVPGTETKPPVTEGPTNPPTTERVKCECECKVDGKLVKKGMKDGKMGFEITDVKGECKNKPCPNAGTIVACSLVKITYSSSIGSGKEIAEIDGPADKSSVSVRIKGCGPFTMTIVVTATCSDGSTCWVPFSIEENIPCTVPNACNIAPEEKVEPAMVGGLKPKYASTGKLIRRDDYIELGAEGSDMDMLKWSCNPTPECKDTRSEKTILLNSKVRFEWEILSKDDGSFVKLGCLPINTRSDKGDNVIFKPPVVPLPVKARDTSVTMLIKLTVIDDNPTQPLDGNVEKMITIITKRSKDKPDFYSVEIRADKPDIMRPLVPPPVSGTCQTVGPKWEMTDELVMPVISLPAVFNADKMVLGQWIVLETQEQHDGDKLTIGCVSATQCPTGPWSKVYQDNVMWEWKLVSGGGRLVSDPTGRTIIYEAPMEMPKGKDMIEVKIKVNVKNGGGKVSDKEYDGEIVLKVYQPGVKLGYPGPDWLPAEDNSLELKSELMYKDGDWKPALAHMCRIHYFELMNVSTEKGVCLNSPVPKEADDCRDLKLNNEGNHESFDDKKGAGKCDKKEMYQQARTRAPEKEYTIKVYSLDFGSYGFLRSFANVNKAGRDSIRGEKPVYIAIPAHVAHRLVHPQGRRKKVNYGDNRVTIPYDIDENHIADGGWKTIGAVAVPDPADNKVDEDDQPTGDNFKGDGITTYEEYRGFKISTKGGIVHTRTNYQVKNVFIRNENNLPIDVYEDVSDLDVHEITGEQYINDDKRFINFNFNKATHLAFEQRGLHLVDKGNHSSLLGIAYSSTGQPTIPNWEIEIRVYSDKINALVDRKNTAVPKGGMKLSNKDKLAAVVAHELSHGNNVCHHGEGDPSVERAFDLIHGLRSGAMECVMRYDNVGTPLSNIPELPGTILCASAAGTGYNANGQHFQDANKKRGNCKGQIRISAAGGLPKSCGNR